MVELRAAPRTNVDVPAKIDASIASRVRRQKGNGQLASSLHTAPFASPVEPRVVTRLLHAAGVEQVRLEVADLHGIARSKLVPIDYFANVLDHGADFYGGTLHWDVNNDSLLGAALPDHLAHTQDYVIVPDLNTLAILAHVDGVARVTCDLYERDGASSPFAPRQIVRNLLNAYSDLGYRPRLGFEYEFSLLRDSGEPAFVDRQYSATLRNTGNGAFMPSIYRAMPALGIRLAGCHVEAAPGQMELTFEAASGMAAVDQAFAFRTTVKEVAAQCGYRATFMTKPAIHEEANALHVHQSLEAITDGRNAFADDGPTGLSDLARAFLGGQLAHGRALTAFLSPTVNCYKAYQPGTFSPTTVSWGYDDRRAAIRIPHASGQATRIENRIGGAAADPYIAAIGLLASGLDGIRRFLAPGVGPAEPLPATLDEALDALERDVLLRELIGTPFLDLYIRVKRKEVELCRAAVGDYADESFHARIDPLEHRWYSTLL
jgi:glutamine synthetase